MVRFILAFSVLLLTASVVRAETITITAADRARMCTPNCRVCLCPFAVGERVHIHYGDRHAVAKSKAR